MVSQDKKKLNLVRSMTTVRLKGLLRSKSTMLRFRSLRRKKRTKGRSDFLSVH